MNIRLIISEMSKKWKIFNSTELFGVCVYFSNLQLISPIKGVSIDMLVKSLIILNEKKLSLLNIWHD